MTDEAIIKGTYIQLQTYKERPYVTLHIDFPEEMHQEIVQKLGVPTKGTSKWLAVALLRNEVDKKPPIVAESVEQEKPIELLPLSEEKKKEARACVDRLKDRLKAPVTREDRGTQNNNELSKNEKSTGHNLSPVEKSEGEKLRIRACCLCGEQEFQRYATKDGIDFKGGYARVVTQERLAAEYIYHVCNIKSRSELITNVAAQEKFKELDLKFVNWRYEQRYKDNLDKED